MKESLLQKILDSTNGKQRRAVAILLVGLGVLSWFVVSNRQEPAVYIAESGVVRDDTVLRIAVNTNDQHHYDTPGTPVHFNLMLARLFAEEAGKKLQMVDLASRNESLAALRDGHADLILSNEIESRVYPKTGLRSIPISEVSLLLIGMQGPSTAPLGLSELQNKTIAVNRGSQIAEFMQQHKGRWPGIELIEVEPRSTGELLEMVMNTQVQYTVVQSNEFLTLQHFFPDLITKFEFAGSFPVCWVASTGRPELVTAVEQFLRDTKVDGRFAELANANSGHMWDFNYSEATTFLTRVNTLLPKYEKLFREAATFHELDWRLLAAMAHQESHWDPAAESPTGVRGMMMLTRNTAGEMGVSDRLNAEQSIRGGAAYLRRMLDLLPEDIADPDRLWIAVAAYNVGRGHVLDAQQITATLGADPNNWQHLRRFLPLLADPLWNQSTRHGAARGNEPVTYVDNVRRYYDMLLWITRQREAESLS